MLDQSIHERDYFVTVDAETDVIKSGVRVLSEIRDDVEQSEQARIPMTWFVRFQRGWDESVLHDCADYFRGPMKTEFDGFALLGDLAYELQNRGDELGWHYHAYHYVHRDDLQHDTRVDVLKQDLMTCGREMRRRYPDVQARSFRFGWFFVPSYDIFPLLREMGVDIDASVSPQSAGENVNGFECKYLDPITVHTQRINGTLFVPSDRTLLIHDWNVVAHHFNWHQQNEQDAYAMQNAFRGKLLDHVRKVRNVGGDLCTYQSFAEKSRTTRR